MAKKVKKAPAEKKPPLIINENTRKLLDQVEGMTPPKKPKPIPIILPERD